MKDFANQLPYLKNGMALYMKPYDPSLWEQKTTYFPSKRPYLANRTGLCSIFKEIKTGNRDLDGNQTCGHLCTLVWSWVWFLTLRRNKIGEEEEQGETHAERYARTIASIEVHCFFFVMKHIWISMKCWIYISSWCIKMCMHN